MHREGRVRVQSDGKVLAPRSAAAAFHSEIEKDAANPLLHGVAQLSITPLVDIASVNLSSSGSFATGLN